MMIMMMWTIWQSGLVKGRKKLHGVPSKCCVLRSEIDLSAGNNSLPIMNIMSRDDSWRASWRYLNPIEIYTKNWKVL